MSNHRTVLPTIPEEEQETQKEKIVAYQTEVEVLQAEMMKIKKLN